MMLPMRSPLPTGMMQPVSTPTPAPMAAMAPAPVAPVAPAASTFGPAATTAMEAQPTISMPQISFNTSNSNFSMPSISPSTQLPGLSPSVAAAREGGLTVSASQFDFGPSIFGPQGGGLQSGGMQRVSSDFGPMVTGTVSAPAMAPSLPAPMTLGPATSMPAFSQTMPSMGPTMAPISPAPMKPVAPVFTPAMPSFQPTMPSFAPVAPTFKPVAPSFVPAAPTFKPVAPTFTPTAPSFQPTAPTFKPVAPSMPSFQPAAPTFKPVAPTFTPVAPSFVAPVSTKPIAPSFIAPLAPKPIAPQTPQRIADPAIATATMFKPDLRKDPASGATVVSGSAMMAAKAQTAPLTVPAQLAPPTQVRVQAPVPVSPPAVVVPTANGPAIIPATAAPAPKPLVPQPSSQTLTVKPAVPPTVVSKPTTAGPAITASAPASVSVAKQADGTILVGGSAKSAGPALENGRVSVAQSQPGAPVNPQGNLSPLRPGYNQPAPGQAVWAPPAASSAVQFSAQLPGAPGGSIQSMSPSGGMTRIQSGADRDALVVPGVPALWSTKLPGGEDALVSCRVARKGSTIKQRSDVSTGVNQMAIRGCRSCGMQGLGEGEETTAPPPSTMMAMTAVAPTMFRQMSLAEQYGIQQMPKLTPESFQLFYSEDAIKRKQYLIMGIVGAVLVATAGVVIYKRRKAMRSA